MDTLSEEDIGNQTRKSESGSGGKTRRFSSIGISRKSVGDEGNIVPHYLRASTGSCHDFCKYGKKHEQSKSAIPVKFKTSNSVNREKVTKTKVPVEGKKPTTLTKVKPVTDLETQTPVEVNKKDIFLPSKKAQVVKPASKAIKNEPKLFQRSTSLVKPSPVRMSLDGSGGSSGGIIKKDLKTVNKSVMAPKTVAAKKVPIESKSPKASFSRAASLKAIKYKSIKQVAPLKDQNRLQKTKPKQTVSDKIQVKKPMHGVEAESEVKDETIEFDFIHPASESISGNNVVEEEFVEAESVVKDETIQFGFIHPASEAILGKNVVEEEFVETESEVKAESMEFDFNHPDADFINPASETFPDKDVVKEEFVEAKPEVKLETLEFDFVTSSSESFPGQNVGNAELTVDETSEDIPDKKLFEESAFAPHVAESLQSCSDKDVLEGESFIAPPVSESSESFYDEEVALDDESEYTDDEEVEVSEEEIETGLTNTEQVGTFVGNPNKYTRKGRTSFSEDKDEEAIKLRFRRGKILDVKSENNGPRRLKFRKGRVVEGKEADQHIARRSFDKKNTKDRVDSNNAPESVVLKHQGEQEKKDAQVLFNNVIEETASKLVESRKSKVKALVGAFETVISLQDGKP
uniref:uncharacterized protein LOC122587075 n=1 Tax=Erigeron canadensis TaxID=72917 RepID=UPI001CB9C488|nr:uncharacterized protein LOC122587075 [Erigeron canadensis]